jgi:cobalamin biosynthesis Co2+ chelatase CbiK
LYPLLFTFFVLVGFVGVDFLKIVRANQSYSFYSQSMTICRPYLDDRRAELLASQFAMVRSRDDYMNVIQQLRQVADANHLQLPNFSPW